ncbi:hypothetical protein SLEP1_g18936 [Rubroshorea leprosula]|uniref:Uncharacterized protein n=1 Tax=Rubroshorea leprosula TaxID=152421 RepID=A0AAV5J9R7_9ROSI|nr:hypothetical protein SLEP1_g18936 [Rubroshorea leprosula]
MIVMMKRHAGFGASPGKRPCEPSTLGFLANPGIGFARNANPSKRPCEPSTLGFLANPARLGSLRTQPLGSQGTRTQALGSQFARNANPSKRPCEPSAWVRKEPSAWVRKEPSAWVGLQGT